MGKEKEKIDRDRQVRWLRELRTRTQYLSLVLRPQGIRQLWMKERDNYKKKVER
jgi:hypothetical protein